MDKEWGKHLAWEHLKKQTKQGRKGNGQVLSSWISPTQEVLHYKYRRLHLQGPTIVSCLNPGNKPWRGRLLERTSMHAEWRSAVTTFDSSRSTFLIRWCIYILRPPSKGSPSFNNQRKSIGVDQQEALLDQTGFGEHKSRIYTSSIYASASRIYTSRKRRQPVRQRRKPDPPIQRVLFYGQTGL